MHFLISGAHWALNLAALVPLTYAAIALSKILRRRQEELAAKEQMAWPIRTKLLTEESLRAIERRFMINLPHEYRMLLTKDKSDYGLLYSEPELIEENERCRTAPVYSDYWDASWFAVHADGSGNVYFITTDPYDGRIYDYDHEQTLPGYEALKSPAFESMEKLFEFLYEPRRNVRQNKRM